jgi:hypothetical protein
MKLAKDMSIEERKLFIEEIARQQRESIELDMTKKASVMSEGEKREWLAKLERKFGR